MIKELLDKADELGKLARAVGPKQMDSKEELARIFTVLNILGIEVLAEVEEVRDKLEEKGELKIVLVKGVDRYEES